MSQIINQSGFVSDDFAQYRPVRADEYDRCGAIHLAVEDSPAAIAPHFDTVDLIVIPFDSSADGRGFSLARQLRALGYRGHLRASGHILVDQFRAALRSGFNDIEISDEQAQRNPERQWRAVPLGRSYQTHITL